MTTTTSAPVCSMVQSQKREVTPEEIWETLEPMLERIRLTVFIKPTVPNYQLMGVLLAKMFRWDGCEIMAVAHEALEDSNFHSEAKLIADEIETGGCRDELE